MIPFTTSRAEDKTMKATTQVLLSLMSATAMSAALAQGTPAVQVTAWGRHQGGQVVYEYEVRNLSSQPVLRLLVGHDPSAGRAELNVVPATTPGSFWLSSSAANRPAGWGARISFPEDSATFSIDWIEAKYFKQLWPQAPSVTDSPAPVPGGTGIPAGTAWRAFSVSVPVVDAAYVRGRASIAVNDDLINVAIQQGDTTPPVINASVTRVNQNAGAGEWAIFDVKASVSDNYDPAPEMTFTPITANQSIAAGDVVLSQNSDRAWNLQLRNAPGRTYQLKWVAVDASGNTSTKTYEYSVLRK